MALNELNKALEDHEKALEANEEASRREERAMARKKLKERERELADQYAPLEECRRVREEIKEQLDERCRSLRCDYCTQHDGICTWSESPGYIPECDVCSAANHGKCRIDEEYATNVRSDLMSRLFLARLAAGEEITKARGVKRKLGEAETSREEPNRSRRKVRRSAHF